MSRPTVCSAPFKFFLFHFFFSFHVFFVDGLRPPAEQVNYIFKWIMIVFELYFVCRVVIQPCVKYLVCIAILRLKFVYYYMQSTHTYTANAFENYIRLLQDILCSRLAISTLYTTSAAEPAWKNHVLLSPATQEVISYDNMDWYLPHFCFRTLSLRLKKWCNQS